MAGSTRRPQSARSTSSAVSFNSSGVNVKNLLRDPDQSSVADSESSTPRKKCFGSSGMRDVFNGESEKQSAESHAKLRNITGCNLHDIDLKNTFQNRKNVSSGPEQEYTYKKNRGDAPRWYQGSPNTILDPDSRTASSQRKTFGKKYETSGDIIRDPPQEAERKSRKQADRGRTQLVDHGDIISGRDQTVIHSSGKRQTGASSAAAHKSTLSLLKWDEGGRRNVNEGQDGMGTPQPKSARMPAANSSSQVQRVL
ncbi:hypothetical protein GUITHDRAFT_154822, partial [Guillardia theta CCMP2712]